MLIDKEFLESLNIPTEALGDYHCTKHDLHTTIVGYCPKCQDEEKQRTMVEKTISLCLAQIEPEFRKFGRNFSIKDFEPENEKKKQIGESIDRYIKNCVWGSEDSIRGLVFYGNQGNGKSMLSNLIQYEALKSGKSTRRITQYHLYNDLLEDRKQIEYYREPDFLFLDEVGRIKGSEYSDHTFFDLINYRYSKLKPTIITTNLDRKRLGEFIDEDRMKEFRIVEFNWGSRRGK